MGWLTATADWVYLILTGWMLGVRPGYDGITVDPRLPSLWKEASITRKIREYDYEVHIRREGPAAEVVCFSIDGKPRSGSLIPYLHDQSYHIIDVTIQA